MKNILKKHYGFTDNGREVSTYSMKNASGMKVKITDFGGAVMQIKVPDRDGRFSDVAHPVTRELRREIEEKVLDAYNAALSEL